MSKLVISTICFGLVAMVGGPAWADVLADYSWDCDVLATSAGWNSYQGFAEAMEVVDIGGGNKAVHWDAPPSPDDYNGIYRDVSTTLGTDWTYEIRFQILGTCTKENAMFLGVRYPRLGDVGGSINFMGMSDTGETEGPSRMIIEEWSDPMQQTTIDDMTNLGGGWKTLRTTWDWETDLSQYVSKVYLDDEIAANVGVGDDTDGFKELFTAIVPLEEAVIFTGSEPSYTGWLGTSIWTVGSNPSVHDESIDYVRWVDQAVAPGEALTPEPATLAVLGLGGLVALLRRRS